jgi:hypothetical protein
LPRIGAYNLYTINLNILKLVSATIILEYPQTLLPRAVERAVIIWMFLQSITNKPLPNPSGYDENAKYHQNTLKVQNKNRAFKSRSLDHYILLTFFPDLKKEADAAAKASKSLNKNAGKLEPSAAGKTDGGRPNPSASPDSSSA